jgi:hypothetical protein
MQMMEPVRRSRSTLRLVALVGLVVLVGTACAAGPNSSVDVPSADGDVAGFWLGLWHGIIVPITFIVSLFSDTVNPYEVHNSGGWYDFGFLFGASMSLGGSGAGARSTRR